MTIIQAIFLGLVQGAAEFLPISSSAHLIIVPWIFHFSDPGLSFDVALHVGTLIAVVLYFWKEWIEIFKLALKNNIQNLNFKTTSYQLPTTSYSKNILWLLALATVPGIIAGYFLESDAETIFRSPILIAFTLSAVGLILYLVDRYHAHKKNMDQINWLDSLWIGLSQAVAVIPGVSRSGSTISTGLFLGLSRESAARFSFLLSTPIILGAAVVKLPHLFVTGLNSYLIVGMTSAAVSGYFAIKYLLKFIEKTSYSIFFWYRLAVAILILAVYFSR